MFDNVTCFYESMFLLSVLFENLLIIVLIINYTPKNVTYLNEVY